MNNTPTENVLLSIIVILGVVALGMFALINVSHDHPASAAERYARANEERTARFVVDVARSEHVLNGVSGKYHNSFVDCIPANADIGRENLGTHLTNCKMRIDFPTATLRANYYVLTNHPPTTWRNFVPADVDYRVLDEFLDAASIEVSPGLQRVRLDGGYAAGAAGAGDAADESRETLSGRTFGGLQKGLQNIVRPPTGQR